MADSDRLDAKPKASLSRPQRAGGAPAWLNGVFAGISLYFFLCAINVMGSGLKTLGKHTDWLENALAAASSPPIALMVSVLVTAVVQSSSFTTAMIITLVAATNANGDPVMSLQTAVYAIMGANIGTSVTNIMVALLGNIRIRRQFRRAFTAALVHDVFNWLTVALLFPLEWISSAMSADGLGLLARFSQWAANTLELDLDEPSSPIKTITKPIVEGINSVVEAIFGAESHKTVGVAVAVIGLAMLFVALVSLVKNLKGALLRHIEGFFRRVFFRNDLFAYVVGAFTTVAVQSSSVTTSLIVPLAGAGAVKLKRVFPYTLGANLGTTVTGVIAATANPVPVAVTVAIAHVTFNLIGTAIWYPLRVVPLRIATWFGRVASRSKRYAVLFLLLVFFVFPLSAIGITKLVDRRADPITEPADDAHDASEPDATEGGGEAPGPPTATGATP